MKKHEFLKAKKDIEAWLQDYGIREYSLIKDNQYGLIVNVNTNVNLNNLGLHFIPVKFGVVKGDFYCSNNNLSSLEFAPTKVKIFDCMANQLKSLKGCPKEISNYLDCSSNRITSLKYCSQKINNLFCAHNKIKSLEGCPKIVIGEFDIGNNLLKSLEYCPDIVGNFFFQKNPIENFIYFPKEIIHHIQPCELPGIGHPGFNKKDIFQLHFAHKALAEKKELQHLIIPQNLNKELKSFKI